MPNILFVEDDRVSQKLVLQILSNWDYEVFVANDGATAIEAIKDKRFDLILLDLYLPDVDGVTIARMVRNAQDVQVASTPIIAHSASEIANSKVKAMQLGMTDFALKPVNAAELHFKIRQYVPHDDLNGTVSINFDLFGESDPSFRAELVILLINNLRELQLASYRAFFAYDKQALMSSLHKVKSAINLLNDRQFSALIDDVKEAFVTNRKKEIVQEKIKELNKMSEAIIRSLSKTDFSYA